MSSLRKSKFALGLLFVIAAMSGIEVHAQQSIHGKFSLLQPVRWGAAVIPAGEYKFVSTSTGPTIVLLLQAASKRTSGYLVATSSVENTNWSGPSNLTLISRGKENFVSCMRLSQYGMVLNFPVPVESVKQVAQMSTPSITSAAQ